MLLLPPVRGCLPSGLQPSFFYEALGCWCHCPTQGKPWVTAFRGRGFEAVHHTRRFCPVAKAQKDSRRGASSTGVVQVGPKSVGRRGELHTTISSTNGLFSRLCFGGHTARLRQDRASILEKKNQTIVLSFIAHLSKTLERARPTCAITKRRNSTEGSTRPTSSSVVKLTSAPGRLVWVRWDDRAVSQRVLPCTESHSGRAGTNCREPRAKLPGLIADRRPDTCRSSYHLPGGRLKGSRGSR